MSDEALAGVDLGPPRKTGDNWYFAPRPAESLDAAEVEIVSAPIHESDSPPDPDPPPHDPDPLDS